MAYSERILRQLGNPSGMLGRFVLWRLNRVNSGMNQVALAALALSEGDRVLEIGFGGGALLDEMIVQRKALLVAGAERSQLAFDTARARLGGEIDGGGVELVECSDTSLPLDDATFSKVCCVNVIYFWPDVRAMMVEVLRVLHPGGSFVLCYAEGAPDRVNKIPPEMVERLLGDAGFSSQTTSHGHDRENGDYHCTVAVKP